MYDGYPLNNSSARQAASGCIPGSIVRYVTGVNTRGQRTCNLMYDGDPLNNSSSRQAASGCIPGSIVRYVTGVNTRGQRTCNVKYDGDCAVFF